MDNITNTVKEKMQKTYSFTGTQLLVTWLGVVILLGIFACIGKNWWPRGMMNHEMMRWDKWQMMQQYDRQWMKWEQKKGMKRWQLNNQGQTEPMMNNNQNNQQTPPSISTGTWN